MHNRLYQWLCPVSLYSVRRQTSLAYLMTPLPTCYLTTTFTRSWPRLAPYWPRAGQLYRRGWCPCSARLMSGPMELDRYANITDYYIINRGCPRKKILDLEEIICAELLKKVIFRIFKFKLYKIDHNKRLKKCP